MKGLLQSKRFKANLKKWLFMYIGVMGLLTTVITYSKYIMNSSADDAATIPKFNVYTEQLDCPSTDQECLNVYRPTGQRIPFYFKVNSSEIETDADLILTFSLMKNFELVEINELVTTVDSEENPVTTLNQIFDNSETDFNSKCKNGYSCLSNNLTFDTGIDESELTLSIKRDKIYTTRGETTYKLVVKYNCKDSSEIACDLSDVFGTNKELQVTDAVRIGYSAIQRSN